ncbi:MAG: DsbA family oxidoreductase [Hydrotalea flava]|jgi:predicted DsbA family dithiol-disulfide isomerase|uniref:DsbA family oxidoreductase n=1 Tax=Hydrotalea TaxID=1004300 RepID=UPI00094583A7|nr:MULTISPECIES: DsbA family oxidoreductase [Hydrotalea]MBY0348032.1 DsbA family oxidoreductase [Hydrotalea flava]NIM34267.1 DsbA family oxidoreductase [Hydrotalea flava]NIM37091.1 DsbA family oxidoreductase [Hydrotalea flava]NIN02281.1 DsbA family oxidoreductase [Hydrotalea flava]NIN13936.1 DsbA family oxidoreductase [Hydrotalea flava]
MQVEIWSDVVCPFCYIGKRKFEKAFASFDGKDTVEIIWRSFQLDADFKPTAGTSVHEYLANRKGVPLEKGKEMNNYMQDLAKAVGLDFQFDKAIVNNTFNAHRLLHLAKEYGVQSKVKELLLAAYFTEGKDIGNAIVLADIGEKAGITKATVLAMLQSDALVDAVRADQYTAQQIGVQGVPFFVFNQKYAVSGAQEPATFLKVFKKVQEEEQPVATNETTGRFCTTDGVCL